MAIIWSEVARFLATRVRMSLCKRDVVDEGSSRGFLGGEFVEISLEIWIPFEAKCRTLQVCE